MPQPATVLITGATSGLGRALALEYARAGRPLALTGRDRARLESVGGEARTLGADVVDRALDVTDGAALAAWIAEVDRERPLELVIANAGVAALSKDGETEEEAREILRVNVRGVLNTVFPALAAMRPRGRGRIAVMSSIASFLPIPTAPAYSASKFAVRAWAEALRLSLWREGIRVTAVCPGFIRTPMTEGVSGPMPFAVDADAAARRIARGLRRSPARLVFPRRTMLLVRAASLLPEAVQRMLAEAARPGRRAN